MGLCCVWGSYGVVMKQLWGCAHRVVLVLGAGQLWGGYGAVMGQLWGGSGAVMGRVVMGRCHRVVLVLGAGRGPLVNAALRAARMAQRRIRVYAVEKNPNAVVT